MAGPYAGLKVLDLSHVVAGPMCTRLLADLGADVVHVEQRAGDLLRAMPMLVDGEDGDLSTAFIQYNNGKRSLGLDLKREAGLALALELADWADVVVENFRPGVLAKLGLGYDVLRERNPKVVLCSLSTFGQTGPYSHMSGFGLVAEAYSGLMSLTGEEGGTPMHFGTVLADTNSAVHALAAIGAALFARERNGEGTHIDISAFDTLHAMIDQAHALGAFSGGERGVGKYGRRHGTSVPSGVARTADGEHVAYGLSGPVFWNKLLLAMASVEGLAEDPRFETSEGRVANAPALYDIIEEWAAGFATADALVDHLTSFGLSGARVRSVAENLADPHLVERGSLAPVAFDGVGEVLLQTAPYRFTGMEAKPGIPAAHVGEHTSEVLRDVLGRSPEEIAGLFAGGAVHGG
jgi:crotonobetainyl-CoA:carnitine CoA-transferase CaiB-like acyl-CoA transferase